ncbi:ABC transporter substrate-binding protein [Sphaerisporangium fuscum]|uniref:ABC transporter substrate-binding protein n=1 Tax=Sphaerisporangium fuscum TaxID=2835868 RepID=UPI001BDBCAE8|nr:extracellular solute-binding protein [Sphaerisporangium fuscum]
MKLRNGALGVAALTLGLLSAACGGSPSSSAGDASADKASGPVHIKVWAWYPEFKSVVENFNATHKDVQVDWVQAGVGQDEYTKLKTALKAGTGAPDVVMIEFQELPTINITKHLLDMGQYGANEDKGAYAEWAWNQASDGDKVYAIPVDGGPMAMLYRKDIFDKYKLPVPKTWDEYKQAAEKLQKADPSKFITAFGTSPDAAGWLQGLFWQAGSRPYTYSAAKLPSVGVTLNDANAKKVMEYWSGMVSAKLADPTAYGTPDFYAGLTSGKYATYLAAGWGPGYLSSVAAKTSGKWRAAPLPQWTAGGNDQGDWGGSAFSVTDQTKHPKEATLVARELYGTGATPSSDAAWKIGIDKAFLFPTATKVLQGDYFKDKTYSFFGDQKVNQVFVPASDGLTRFDWSPFQDFAYNQLTEQLGQAVAGKTTWSGALDTLQQKVGDYARQQGFTVSPASPS